MCGICGIYSRNEEAVDRDLLSRMNTVLKHRGPDGEGYYVAGNIGLGHRRLSIIDLAGGSQPVANEDERLFVVFNGEIYNFIELREELKRKGHRFKTASDTEVIVHAYEEWGTECVTRFNGIFAFALWDREKKNLFLARDHLGVKPLYYAEVNGNLYFASEIKSILQFPGFRREVDLKSLGELFTFHYVPSPNTLFRGIKKIPPATFLFCNGNGIQMKRFWNWRPEIRRAEPEEELIREYRDLLQDAIRLQLRSDVPVGLFLSSGSDSGALLAAMRSNETGPIHTFTLGFEDGAGTNETDDARELARHFDTDHREMLIGPRDYETYYERYLWDIEEPVGNETAAAFFFVSKMASEKVKVALTGQGADEPWAGYHRYIGVRLSTLYSRLPRFLTRPLGEMIYLLPRNERLKRGVDSLGERDVLTRFTKIYSFFNQNLKDRLFQDWVKEEMGYDRWDPREALAPMQEKVRDMDPLSQMLFLDTRTNLPDDLLMVNDKTSMANSLEARVPFLDYRLVEFIETLPPHLKLKGLRGKYLHKKAVASWLPKGWTRKKKKGFANPITKWFRGKMGSYVEECFRAPDSALNTYFRPETLNRILTLHREKKEEYIRHIDLLISFELWHRRFVRTASC